MNGSEFFSRNIEASIAQAMTDTPVVLLLGPRQSGKTTLVRKMAQGARRYLTLDDPLTRLSAQEDPIGMIRNLDQVVIDEVQRAPELLLAIKKSVDEDRRFGRFILTGSSNLMTMPQVADSLAGRMETLTLLPLSQSEMEGRRLNWLDCVFDGRLPMEGSMARSDDLVARVLRGGYPEAVSRSAQKRRTAWMRQYMQAIMARDVQEVSGIAKLDQLPRYLSALSQTVGQMCNYTQLGGRVGLDAKTAAKYIHVFEQVYFLLRVPAWSRNRLNRLVKSPKLHFIDSGLLATLLDLSVSEIEKDKTRLGPVLETFVFSELIKHRNTAEGQYRFMHYRDLDQVEVDFVIENAQGHLIGVEIKASATVKQTDLRGLKKLKDLAGSDFKMGILLYDGDETMPLGEDLWAAPLSTLWGN
jgi:predicted AAA+ superfamily ATPase